MSFGLPEDFLPFFFRRKVEAAISLERKEIVEIGEFRLDVDVHTIERIERGRKGTLTEKAFQVLVLLVRLPGQGRATFLPAKFVENTPICGSLVVEQVITNKMGVRENTRTPDFNGGGGET